MAQRKHIKLCRIITLIFIFVLLVNIIFSRNVSAYAWIPKEGKYKISSSILATDSATKTNQKNRAKMLATTHDDINILLQKEKLTQQEEYDLQMLKHYSNNHDAFNDYMFVGNDIEYGFSKNQSFGLKINFNLEKDLQYKYTNTTPGKWFKINLVKELGLYYKHLIYYNDRWNFSLMPEFIYHKNNISSDEYSYIIGSYIGYSKINKSGKKYFIEVGFSIGKKHTPGHNSKNSILKKISISEGVEILKKISLINYFEYNFTSQGNLLYRNVAYEQLSLSKKFMENNQITLIIQGGYYWKKSLSNKMFQTSGPIFSVCVDI